MNGTRRPADVARAAMEAVQESRRDDWLALFSADARVEDPVGHLAPIVGRERLAEFWDLAIDPLASTCFTITRVWEAGTEAMVLATVTASTPDTISVDYDGTFNYRVGADGLIVEMRAFWDLPDVVDALTG
ncbi:nuclear transport factor 2 family protein [Mycobacterium sp. AMU20-3851]|uniref:nuclear transport factor 2 family protein n=1 Tax=Mycobacterium sp. AMU20-3851 TaxID=3122055 RepID=UPI003753EDFA